VIWLYSKLEDQRKQGKEGEIKALVRRKKRKVTEGYDGDKPRINHIFNKDKKGE